MNSTPDDELISAYLDDELNEAERARVEAMLVEQPEARQLMEDLRALRGGFEGLPVHRLDDSFVDRVMRGAERELLAGVVPDADVDVEHVEGEPIELHLKSTQRHASEPELREELRLEPARHGWRRFRRPLAWAGAALAAGLLLMIFDRTPPARGPQVAQAPLDDAPAEAEWRRKEARDSGRDEALAKAPQREAQTAKAADGRQTADRIASPAAADPQGGLGGRPPGQKPFAASGTRMAGKAAAAPAEYGGLAAGAPAADADANQAAMPRALGERFRKLDRLNAYQDYVGYDLKRIEDGKLVAETLDDKTLIVWCDVDKDVADRPEFRQLLASNRIAWESSSEEIEQRQAAANNKVVAEKLAKKEAADAAKPAAAKAAASLGLEQKQAAGGEKAAEADSGGDEAAQQRGSERKPNYDALERTQIVAETVNAADADYVLVKATADQLKGVLAEFDRHPELFLSVNVEPSPAAPEQRAYAAYNRGRQVDEQGEQTAQPLEEAKKAPVKSAVGEPQADTNANGPRPAAAVFGRAQRVVILPQLAQSPDLEGAAPEPEAPQSQPLSSSLRRADKAKRKIAVRGGKEAMEFRFQRSEQPSRPKANGAAETEESEDKPATAVATEQVRPDYQQALFIFRHVQSTADSSPASKADR